MTTPNNQPSAHEKPILTKRYKQKESLSFATWVLLVFSFTCLAYAIYTIQTRIVHPAVDIDIADTSKSSLVKIDK